MTSLEETLNDSIDNAIDKILEPTIQQATKLITGVRKKYSDILGLDIIFISGNGSYIFCDRIQHYDPQFVIYDGDVTDYILENEPELCDIMTMPIHAYNGQELGSLIPENTDSL